MTEGLSAADGATLAGLAAAAVQARLAGGALAAQLPMSAALRACAASFVTLEAEGTLRGCIGTIEPARPLYLDVIRNAGRAMNDPRLPPVTVVDWPALDIKVAVLTQLEPIVVADREALLGELRPGIDGLVLADEVRRATFLPAVWEKVPEPDGFLAALLRKGGWPQTGWPARMTVKRYTTSEFYDRAPREALAGPVGVARG
jgi:AmmeMemoRadiSam system protein A